MRLRSISIYWAIVLLAPVATMAQNQLSGKIVYSEKATPAEGVSVYIPDIKTGTITDKAGLYVLKNIPAGDYLVEISRVGYAAKLERITIKGAVEKNFVLNISGTELQEVIVTGVSTATDRRKEPIPVSTITQADLVANPSGNIIDALTVVPGVSAITEGPAISKPVIRGLGYNRVVVINDGVRQEGNQWGDEFGIEIDENTVAKAEILKGPASLSYGSDAMAGVINFLSPAPLPEGKIKGSLLADYQTNNGLFNNTINFAGNRKGFIWDLRYTNKQAHAYKNKYDGYVWNSGYGENDFKAILGINRDWGYSHLHLSLFDLKLGIIEGARDSASGQFESHYLAKDGSDSLGIAPADGYTKYNYYPIIHQHVRHYKAVWDNSVQLGGGRLSVKLGLQQNFRQEANDITVGDVYNNYFYLRTINYDVQYILPEIKQWQLSFGANGMGQHSEDRGTVYLVPEYHSFDIGVFSLAKKTFGKLTVSGGLRFDSRTLHGNDMYTDTLGVRVSVPDNFSVHRFTAYNSNFSGLSGSVGLAYDFTKAFYGKLNVSRGFRAPTIAESGANGIHDGTPFYEIGDPNLKPENSLQADVTLGINNEDITTELNLFVNRINNYIFPVKLASVYGGDSIRSDINANLSGPTFRYVSGDAVLSGGELMLNIHPHTIKWFHFENAFSTVSAVQLHQDDSTKYLPYTPPSKLQSKIKISFGHIHPALSNAYVQLGVDHYFEQDKIYYKYGNETNTPAYTLLNAGIGTDVCSHTHTLFSVYLYGYNLADVAYQSNMSRLKYTDTNNITGRVGVYNMGRSFSFKLLIPFE